MFLLFFFETSPVYLILQRLRDGKTPCRALRVVVGCLSVVPAWYADAVTAAAAYGKAITWYMAFARNKLVVPFHTYANHGHPPDLSWVLGQRFFSVFLAEKISTLNLFEIFSLRWEMASRYGMTARLLRFPSVFLWGVFYAPRFLERFVRRKQRRHWENLHFGDVKPDAQRWKPSCAHSSWILQEEEIHSNSRLTLVEWPKEKLSKVSFDLATNSKHTSLSLKRTNPKFAPRLVPRAVMILNKLAKVYAICGNCSTHGITVKLCCRAQEPPFLHDAMPPMIADTRTIVQLAV